MTAYARDLAPRNSFYFNVRLKDRQSDLLVEGIDALRRATRSTMARYPFRIDAIAVLPAEILAIWTLPEGDVDHTIRWSMIKSLFQRDMFDWGPPASVTYMTPGPLVWQRRMESRTLTTRYDFENHCQFIHKAPVMSGLVRQPEHWPYSSLHRELAQTFTDRHARPKIATRMPWSARNRALRA